MFIEMAFIGNTANAEFADSKLKEKTTYRYEIEAVRQMA